VSLSSLTLTSRPRPAPSRLDGLPVAIIGAGPVGLAAAAQLLERGIEAVIWESGPQAGAAIALWGHTRLFTPWQYLVDSAAARLLERDGWVLPEEAELPTGRHLLDRYLLPLAELPELAGSIRYDSTVLAVSRQGMDRTRSGDRAGTPFVLRVRTDAGVSDSYARAVIDTSGTYSSPNALLASGLDPVHADAVQPYLVDALPDVLGVDLERFAGRHTLVVGAGHSAANTLIALGALAETVPGTRISWAIRSAAPVRVYGSADDELAARASLGAHVKALVRSGMVTLVDRFEIGDVLPATNGATGVTVTGVRAGQAFSVAADTVVAATGFRPDLALLREIRLSLDDIVEAPRMLAPLIDPNLHSCGTVPPHGVVELSHPEPNFFIAGMKSFGRAPTFLLATGYEQVRSIADELAGNVAAARQVELVLPETGVCSTGGDSGSCCT